MIPKLEKIKQLLWEEWDPIGVSDLEDWPSDEYDSYAMHIFSMLNDGNSVQDLTEYLLWAETENMGLSPSNLHQPVARSAKQIFEGEL
jgi:hypothetical protein